ncbi:MAG: M23 family metallopeptidase [Spirochaetales bacterium]|nr:M23 family metallopeptidase [Spirochaetales bacterium]
MVKCVLIVLNCLFLFFILSPLFSSIYIRQQLPSGFFVDLPEHDIVDGMIIDAVISEEINNNVPEKSLINRLSVSQYKFQKGDTLSVLAKQSGLRLDTILSFNNIKDVKRVFPGTVLAVPNHDGIMYKVKQGDSLSSIAARHEVPLNDLLDWNNIASSVIIPGEVLFLPGARLRTNDLNRILGRLFIFPTRGSISSPFGKRVHPIYHHVHFHNGIDIANWPGTIVHAAMEGKVIQTGFNNIYGNFIIIAHDDNFQTMYGHLMKILVTKGNYVKQGQKIGKMGNTGLSTGAHLHFSIFHSGVPINPMKYLGK